MVEFQGTDCDLIQSNYANGQIALQLVAANTPRNKAQGDFPGLPIASASVCVPGAILQSGEVIIKDYGENSGMLAALLQGGLVQITERTIPLDYAECHVVTLK